MTQTSKQLKTLKPNGATDEGGPRSQAIRKKEKERQEWDKEAARIDKETNEAAGVTGPPPDGATREEWDHWLKAKITAIYSRPTSSTIWTQLEEGEGELRRMRNVVPWQDGSSLDRFFRGENDRGQPAQKLRAAKSRRSDRKHQGNLVSPNGFSQPPHFPKANGSSKSNFNTTPTKSRMPPANQRYCGTAASNKSQQLSPLLPNDDDGASGRQNQRSNHVETAHDKKEGWISEHDTRNQVSPSTEDSDRGNRNGNSGIHGSRRVNQQKQMSTPRSSSDNQSPSGEVSSGDSHHDKHKNGPKKRKRSLIDDLETSLGEAWDARVDGTGHRPRRRFS